MAIVGAGTHLPRLSAHAWEENSLEGAPESFAKHWRIGDYQPFYERIEGFLATPENRRRMYVEIDGVHYRLRKRSRSSGLFSSRLDLPDGAFTNVMQPGASGFATAPIQLNVVGSESISGVGQVFLASPTGLSVISDIDDTIKSTCVTSRREMLAQTFLRPFTAIDGMAEVYRHWKSDGVLFHYVSSSPWQIYSPLQQFLREHDFPDGSMHLRWFRLRDEMFKRWRLLRRKSKGGVIVSMIKRMPDRRFMLVGDSGERDPEIYAKIAAKFKDQVGMVLIRDLLENRWMPNGSNGSTESSNTSRWFSFDNRATFGN